MGKPSLPEPEHTQNPHNLAADRLPLLLAHITNVFVAIIAYCQTSGKRSHYLHPHVISLHSNHTEGQKVSVLKNRILLQIASIFLFWLFFGFTLLPITKKFSVI